uniref:Uncharacterized protein n=1 Tax=Scleropages formosus TaxID=113540 RepID=A0A8C9S348_SCLFO
QGQDQDLGDIVLVVPVHHGTEEPVFIRLHLGKEELGDGKQARQHPDTHADQLAVEEPLLLQVLGLGGLHNSYVTVHADAGQQHHAAEEIDLEKEVSNGQVKQVNICHGLQAVTNVYVDPCNHQISHSSQDKNDPVEWGLIVSPE